MAYKVTRGKDKITIEIDFKDGDEKTAPINAKTNKSRTIASNGGFQQVEGCPDGVRVQINCIAKV